MDDLVQWLGKQLDEDERIALAVGRESWQPRYVDSVSDSPDTATVQLPDGTDVALMERYSYQDAEHIAEHDPARVLREIDAKRRMLALHHPRHDGYTWVCDTCSQYDVERRMVVHVYAPCEHLRLLALPYADRPGYREEWRP